MDKGIGDEFQKETKYLRDSLPGGMLDWSHKPELYKEYPDAIRKILPPPNFEAVMPFDRILRTRRSVRRFTERALSLEQLSNLLWACTGI